MVANKGGKQLEKYERIIPALPIGIEVKVRNRAGRAVGAKTTGTGVAVMGLKGSWTGTLRMGLDRRMVGDVLPAYER
jgi:hypothetical protein